VVDNAADLVQENASEGVDTVQARISYALTTNVENLTLLGIAAINATGNALNNTLFGNSGANTLDGGAGSDTLQGGLGNDQYVVDNAGDRVIELAGEGYDTVTVNAVADYTLTANVESLVLGLGAINASGNTLNNILRGNASANTLDGKAGADLMFGGAGDDLYIVDDAFDVVVENSNEGLDTVRSSVSYALSANVEFLALTGTANIDASGNGGANTLTGNAGNNRLDGGAGADAMLGGLGNDTYVVDDASDTVVEAANEGVDRVQSSISYALTSNVEELELTGLGNTNATGNGLANTLIGNAGNNTLDGGLGADSMSGGLGDDGYVVDNVGDLVLELSGAGFDRVSATIDYVLPQHVEQLTLGGTAIRGTGNNLDNFLFGNQLANVLDGGLGADQMSGGLGDDRYVVDHIGDTVVEALSAGIDTVVASVNYTLADNVENLVLSGNLNTNGIGNALANVLVGNGADNNLDGGAGNDVLAGGQGNDTLVGGSGDDLYLYNQGEGHDVITDASGIDTLKFGAGITLDSLAARTVMVNGQSKLIVSILGADGQETSDGVEWLLGAGGVSPIERFEFASGQVATLAQISVAPRSQAGTIGNDTLMGDRNDDTISGGIGNDTIYGRAGNDILNGDIGDDKLFGEGGNDSLYGGDNSDQLWGGAGNDLLDGGNGIDTLMGGTGDDKMYGGNDNDLLDGGVGADIMYGDNGADELYGGAGNDRLDGGNESDLLAGGAGDDNILGGNGADVIVAGVGNDTINSDNDSDFIDAGDGNDVIASGSAADFIAGGRGDDTIDAGLDQDVIAFNRGDGADTVLTSSLQRDTLSLGGGIKYADMSLSKVGNNLVLNLGQGDSITFKDWYFDTTRRNITTLQVITAATGGDFSASSTDRMKNRGVVNFNFETLVNRFDQVRATNPTQTAWPLAADLNTYYVSGSNTQALGGDLAYRYATTGSYGDLNLATIRTRLSGFGGATQQTITASTTVNPWVALQAGISLIADQTVGLPSPITIVPAPTQDELIFAAITVSGRVPSWRGGPSPAQSVLT
jgi:Ca2+-binding RTX toxin-like protein